jgi:hypothetical protein
VFKVENLSSLEVTKLLIPFIDEIRKTNEYYDYIEIRIPAYPILKFTSSLFPNMHASNILAMIMNVFNIWSPSTFGADSDCKECISCCDQCVEAEQKESSKKID